MSHTIITCTCRGHDICPVPGHGTVPPDHVAPWALVDAGQEAVRHLNDAMKALMRARGAWVSRGLDATNPFPQGLDVEARRLVATIERLRDWTRAAEIVAERRAPRTNGHAETPPTTDENGSHKEPTHND